MKNIENEPSTNSINIVIGVFSGTDNDIAVWFDGGTGWPGQKFWYGFSSYEKEIIEIFVGLGQEKHNVAGRMLHLDNDNPRPAKIEEFKHPVYEGRPESPDKEFFYGIYHDQTPSNGTKEIKDAADFLSGLAIGYLEHLSNSLGTAEADLLGAEGEERKRVVSHARWERNLKAAKAVKENARFKCHVCKEKMGDKYGDDIGADYAEAHHKIPLAQLEGRKAKITANDLVCVCANCHRMLHRLIAKKGLDGQKALDEILKRVRREKVHSS